ncbi:hypothetical protein [Accumulibacter sp.]|uniref:Uncharacterized protein n=1 Tax=Candidatus Accumulibacter proximus TaxID=2954385 RepID=A0A935Q2K9_9PROT|nr:hypothetical protein [Accumulibacter sp.]MBK7677778.1 hypothetical protein [Candidatus Accumulibacter proximus]MBL8374587.1 hypothetical protein [Accumulibacter sp.]
MNQFSQSRIVLIVRGAAGDMRQGELLNPGNRFTVEHWFKRVRLRHNDQ